jgi:hypothetical protein
MHKIFRSIYIYTREGEIIPLVNLFILFFKKKEREKGKGFHLSVRYLENETRTLSSEHRRLEIIS